MTNDHMLLQLVYMLDQRMEQHTYLPWQSSLYVRAIHGIQNVINSRSSAAAI